MKDNIIDGILNVLYWASWADYIGYIGLTPHMGTQCGTIPIYSNSLHKRKAHDYIPIRAGPIIQPAGRL
jgi:hypothetical protein